MAGAVVLWQEEIRTIPSCYVAVLTGCLVGASSVPCWRCEHQGSTKEHRSGTNAAA